MTSNKAIKYGSDWEGNLSGWLETIGTVPRDAEAVQNYCFPTEHLREEYLATIDRRSNDEVLLLLSRFLFPATTFGGDKLQLEILSGVSAEDRQQLVAMPYYQRLLKRISAKEPVWPGGGDSCTGCNSGRISLGAARKRTGGNDYALVYLFI